MDLQTIILKAYSKEIKIQQLTE